MEPVVGQKPHAQYDIYQVLKDSGQQEERQRVLVEIVLALDKRGNNSWVRDAMLELRQCIENPRPKEELDRELLKSIRAVAINQRLKGPQGDEI